MVDILAAHLCGEGYGVSGALTGDEGLKNFILARPDLVLLDIRFTGEMNGIELDLLGHESVATTEIYTHVSTARQRRVVELLEKPAARRPRAKTSAAKEAGR